MSRSPSIPDRPHRDIDADLPDDERLEALRGHYEELVDVNDKLSAQLDDAEDRRERLREKVDRVERENETLKSSSLYIATVEDVLDDEQVIVKQHGNN